MSRGLAGAWVFGERSGLKVYDSVGASHGTLTNGPTWSNGPYGSRLILTKASDQYVNIGNPAPLRITGSLSIAVRYRLTTAPGASQTMQLFSKDNSSGGRAYTMDVRNVGSNSGGVRLYVNGGGNTATNEALEGRDPVTGDERIAVVTFSPSTAQGIKVYIDGRLSGTNSGTSVGSIPSATASVMIGRRQYGGFTESLNGSIDWAFIWSRALSAREVAEFAADPFRMFRRRPILQASAVGSAIPAVMHHRRTQGAS